MVKSGISVLLEEMIRLIVNYSPYIKIYYKRVSKSGQIERTRNRLVGTLICKVQGI